MTSSLVGSEMCIRDRKNMLPTMKRVIGWVDPDIDYDDVDGCVMQGEIPVSYTHLTLPTICSV
eukprot:1838057-Prorocentrum_lima.AAC.1